SVEAENRLLHRAIETITSSLEMDAVFEATIALVTETTGGDVCFLFLWDAPNDRLALRAASAPFNDAVGKVQLELGEGISGWVAEHREVVVIPKDKWADSRWKYFPELRGELFTSMLSVPMVSGSGELVGVFNVHSRGRHVFSESDVDVLSLVASLIARAIENADLFRALAEKEETLQQLVRRTIDAQEEERRRLATEIHDGVTQQLISIWYRLQACGTSLRANPERAESELATARELVDAALGEARVAIYDLRPSMLDDLGLAPSLRTLAFQQLEGEVEIELEVEDVESLPSHHEVALYRIAQEAVTNIRKHADASRVTLVLREETGSVVLLVRDDGRGFLTGSPYAPGPATSFGLTGMSERAALIGGSLSVRSTPGEGTVLELRIPRQPVEVAG
ncbi:MAG: GAF domain-containing sensor histidine kinase, partial [Actinomycetota bacterium]